MILRTDGGKVKKGQAFVQWDPYNVPILSERAGVVKFHDIIEGVTMKQEVDEATGQEAMVVIDHKEDLHPQVMVLESKNGEGNSQLSHSLGSPYRRPGRCKNSCGCLDGQDSSQNQ